MKAKINVIIFLLTLPVGILITKLLGGVKGLILLTFGWSGMWRLEKTGFPFLWQTKCPITHEAAGFAIPTGCIDGLNSTAFIFNVLFFAILLSLFIKLALYFKNLLLNRL